MSKVAVKKKTQTVVETKAGLFEDVKGYARKVYLAGLGVYVKAGAESASYVKSLISAGEGVEAKGKHLVDLQVEAANGQYVSAKQALTSNVSGVKNKVEVQLDKIEKAFDARVAVALNRIGIPARKDVEALSAKLDELSALLEHVARTK